LTFDLFQALVRKENGEANWTELFFGGEKFSAATIQTFDAADPNDDPNHVDDPFDSIDFPSDVADKVDRQLPIIIYLSFETCLKSNKGVICCFNIKNSFMTWT